MSVNFETALHDYYITDSIYVSHGVNKSNSFVASNNLKKTIENSDIGHLDLNIC